MGDRLDIPEIQREWNPDSWWKCNVLDKSVESTRMKAIGKPYEGKPHVRFDEGVMERSITLLYKCHIPLMVYRPGAKSPFHGFRHILWHHPSALQARKGPDKGKD